MKKSPLFLFIILEIIFLIGLLLDSKISLFILSLRSTFLNDFMIWISYGGTWFVVLFLMTSLFLWDERKRKWILPLWLSLGIAEAVAHLLKLIIMRPRPFESFLIPPLVSSIGSSFPSAHAAAAFSAIIILNKEFPKFKWLWFSLASLVALSRIYLGVHYLCDVAFGAAIGLASGYLIVYLSKRYKWDRQAHTKQYLRGVSNFHS